MTAGSALSNEAFQPGLRGGTAYFSRRPEPDQDQRSRAQLTLTIGNRNAPGAPSGTAGDTGSTGGILR